MPSPLSSPSSFSLSWWPFGYFNPMNPFSSPPPPAPSPTPPLLLSLSSKRSQLRPLPTSQTSPFPPSLPLPASLLASTQPLPQVTQGYAHSALFVQIGAYRGGPNTFAIVGLASKPIHVFGKPWFKCEWVPNSKTSPSIRTKAFKMLPDWGYGRIYTVVVVNCTFPVVPNAGNAGGRLFLYAYYL